MTLPLLLPSDQPWAISKQYVRGSGQLLWYCKVCRIRPRGEGDRCGKKRNMCLFQTVPFTFKKENTTYHSFSQKACFPALSPGGKIPDSYKRKRKKRKENLEGQKQNWKWLFERVVGWWVNIFLMFHFHHHHICAVMKVKSHLMKTMTFWRTWVCVDLCVDVCVLCIHGCECGIMYCVWTCVRGM